LTKAKENAPASRGNHFATGFVMFMRSPESRELLGDPKAFSLLGTIAHRARWRSSLSINDLEPGEALIGDFREAGMTRGEYREAIKRLAKWRLAAFRTTTEGQSQNSRQRRSLTSIARLISRRTTTHATIRQPARSHQTTNGQPTSSH